ncbi:phage major tail tube protein [Neomegalonema sp.]|uniref:phage major tail tube protein n=1 Tax=Neomegalonema sp. TaxID=2039713 RepID=UPI00262BC1B9|nr:phage major tail tube protein [Neomegalonema sp.]MDD2870128.1 phage major tail tube protein [Neomegalonema sp.]
MSKIAVNRVTNANVYMDGRTLLGRAEEVDLPQVKHKMAEHKALGMIGASEFFAGVEKMECKIKWTSFYPEVLRAAADPFKAVRLQLRASLETYTGQGRVAETAVMVSLTAAFKDFPLGSFKQHEAVFKDFPLGSFKQHEAVSPESNLAVHYAKLEIGGQEIFELDVMENIYKVAGADVLARYRFNIGG